jgi:hypothetical protein
VYALKSLVKSEMVRHVHWNAIKTLI